MPIVVGNIQVSSFYYGCGDFPLNKLVIFSLFLFVFYDNLYFDQKVFAFTSLQFQGSFKSS